MKKLQNVASFLLAALLLTSAASTAVAQAGCKACDASWEETLGAYWYRCINWPYGGGSVSCYDYGGGSTEVCIVSGFCDPMLKPSVATIRPDGVMTPAVGLSQLIPPSWLQSIGSRGIVAAATWSSELSVKQPVTGASSGTFSQLFASQANSGAIESSEKCEGYLGPRSYTVEQLNTIHVSTAMLRI